MQEKPLVFHILNLLKGLYVNSSNDAIPWIPTYTTLLLAHALRGVFYPSNFIYPLTARFLLQRPTLDPTDVPMLLGMLYSSGDDWKKERAWIIRFLADGMTCGRDWKVFKRRHTWDLVSSLFQCSETDRVLRQGVLEVGQRCLSLSFSLTLRCSSLRTSRAFKKQ
jgi:nucleolar pre-ribosomal-associated protein 1